MSFRLIKRIFTLLVILGVAFGSYWAYATQISNAEALAVRISSGEYKTELDRINSLYEEVAQMQLGVSLFQEVFFSKLKDQSILLAPDINIGRANPFLPIGEDPELGEDLLAVEPVVPDVDLSLIVQPDDLGGEGEGNNLIDDIDSLIEELGEDLLSVGETI